MKLRFKILKNSSNPEGREEKVIDVFPTLNPNSNTGIRYCNLKLEPGTYQLNNHSLEVNFPKRFYISLSSGEVVASHHASFPILPDSEIDKVVNVMTNNILKGRKK